MIEVNNDQSPVNRESMAKPPTDPPASMGMETALPAVLPPALLAAVSFGFEGRIAFILGAGCSIEPPTAVKASTDLAQEAHDNLISSGFIRAGDCSNPSDLPSLAETVIEKTGSQKALVDVLNPMSLRVKAPNSGYRYLACLMRERIIGSVLTLNYDLALTNTIPLVNGGAPIQVVNGQHEVASLGSHNAVYLHGNANLPFNQWVFTRHDMEESWANGWREVVARRFLATPIAVFAGLGSHAPILTDTAKKINDALGTQGGFLAYNVDPGPWERSAFFADLGLPPDRYIPLGWCTFMERLARSVADAQVRQLKESVTHVAVDLGLSGIDAERACTILPRDLLHLGRVRASWLVTYEGYESAAGGDADLIAQLVLAAGWLADHLACTAKIDTNDGLLTLWRGDRLLATLVLASGRGKRDSQTLESRVRTMFTYRPAVSTAVTAILATAVEGRRREMRAPISLAREQDDDPTDIRGDRRASMPMLLFSELIKNPERLARSPLARLMEGDS